MVDGKTYNDTVETDAQTGNELWVGTGISPTDFALDTEGSVQLGLRGHIVQQAPFTSYLDANGIAHYYMGDETKASFIYSVAGIDLANYHYKMTIDVDPSVALAPQTVSNSFQLLLDENSSSARAAATNPSGYKWVVDTNQNGLIDSNETTAITDDQGPAVGGSVTQNSEQLALFTQQGAYVKPGAYDIILQAYSNSTGQLVASTHIQDDVGLIVADNLEGLGTLASTSQLNGYLYQGTGNSASDMAIVTTTNGVAGQVGSQFELGIGVEYTYVKGVLAGPVTTSQDADGTVHFGVEQISGGSIPGIRFSYSVANTQNSPLSDYFGLYNFELSIDVDPSAGAAGLQTYFLEDGSGNSPYAKNSATTKSSGYVWVLDANGDGSITSADKVSGNYVAITDDEGTSSVTQNIETPAFFDPSHVLSAADLTTGSYNISLKIADLTGAVQAQDNVVIDVNGGAPVTQSGGSGGGGGGTTPPVTPPATPPSTTPVVTSPGSNNAASATLPAPTINIDPTISVDGKTVTITANVAAAAGVQSVELYEGQTPVAPGTLNPDGTYSFAFDNTKGFHTGLSAVVTDVQGLSAAAVTNFDLTGVTGEPYNTVQDNYDASTSAYLGSDFIKSNGVTYFQSTNEVLSNGDFTYSYANGSYFDDKIFSSFVDKYDANGDLLTHVENNNDGSHAQEIDANDQTVKALGTDTFADYANKTTFVFNPGFGQDAIYGFQATGAAHDTLHISSSAGTLAQVLSKATSDGQGGTTLHLGAGDTIDVLGITKAELKAHPSDFKFTATA